MDIVCAILTGWLLARPGPSCRRRRRAENASGTCETFIWCAAAKRGHLSSSSFLGEHSKGSTKVDKVGEQILLFGCNIVILHTNSTSGSFTKSIKHIHVRATWHAPLPNDTVPPTPILLIKHEYHTSLLLAFKEDRDYVVLAESSWNSERINYRTTLIHWYCWTS